MGNIIDISNENNYKIQFFDHFFLRNKSEDRITTEKRNCELYNFLKNEFNSIVVITEQIIWDEKSREMEKYSINTQIKHILKKHEFSICSNDVCPDCNIGKNIFFYKYESYNELCDAITTYEKLYDQSNIKIFTKIKNMKENQIFYCIGDCYIKYPISFNIVKSVYEWYSKCINR